MKNHLIAAAALIGLAAPLAAPVIAAADPPSWAGKGHAHGGRQNDPRDDAQDNSQDNSQDTPRGNPRGNPHGTPPGLAKKPYGLAPGQAKKTWSQGERLPRGYLAQRRYSVADPSRYNLPPAPYGSRWIQVGDKLYLARTDNGLVNQVMSALSR